MADLTAKSEFKRWSHAPAGWLSSDWEMGVGQGVMEASSDASPMPDLEDQPLGSGPTCLMLHPAAPCGGDPDTASFGHIHIPNLPPLPSHCPSFAAAAMKREQNQGVFLSTTLSNPSFICKYLWAIPPNLMARELFTRSSLPLHILL